MPVIEISSLEHPGVEIFCTLTFALYTSFLSLPLIDISLVLFIVYLSKF